MLQMLQCTASGLHPDKTQTVMNKCGYIGDPVLVAPANPRAVNGPNAMLTAEVQAGSNRVTFSEASSLLVLPQQDATMLSDSGSGEPAALPVVMLSAWCSPTASVNSCC